MDLLTPADLYEELFTDVQRARVYDDSKTFADAVPREAPASVLARYRALRGSAGFDLARFVNDHFECVRPHPSTYRSDPGQALGAHIASLWPVLTRQPAPPATHTSLLALPRRYVVPGGRFDELYYWDSYFTLLGLAKPEQAGLLADMVGNFAHLIDVHGHVPNGTRTYYLSRSQPPLFALMVELAEARGALDAAAFLSQLLREHAWWMTGESRVAPGGAERRVVRLADGAVLNRYWDERDTPREEAWVEDVTTAQHCERPAAQVYRDLRAACESGWDFSTRWLDEPSEARDRADGNPRRPGRAVSAVSLGSIRTTAIVPVDLNAFLWRLERVIAALATRTGAAGTAREFEARAAERARAIHHHCWNVERGAFLDHDWERGTQRRGLTAATVVPLFVGLADAAQADAVARTVQARLLAHGGLATTEWTSDQQWDRPNGWAPLQWMAVRGLADHGHQDLACTIAHRWLETVAAIYERESRLVEKYALRHASRQVSEPGGGGEYPLQDGFGWTNGVTAALLGLRPAHSAHGSCAGRRDRRHR